MNSKPVEKAAAGGGLSALPKLYFTREAAPSHAERDARKDVAYNVRSAETLATEFDNRKLELRRGG